MHPSPILPVAFDPFSADPTSESYIPELDLDALESEPSTPKWKQLFNHTRGRSTDNLPWTLRTPKKPRRTPSSAPSSPLKKRHISTLDVHVTVERRRRLSSQATLRPGTFSLQSSDESDLDDDWERLSSALDFDVEPLALELPMVQPPSPLSTKSRSASWSRFKRV